MLSLWTTSYLLPRALIGTFAIAHLNYVLSFTSSQVSTFMAFQDLAIRTTMDALLSYTSSLPPIAQFSFSAPQNGPSRHQRYSAEEWDVMKPLIKEVYIDKNWSLSQLMEMLSENDFHPT